MNKILDNNIVFNNNVYTVSYWEFMPKDGNYKIIDAIIANDVLLELIQQQKHFEKIELKEYIKLVSE